MKSILLVTIMTVATIGYAQANPFNDSDSVNQYDRARITKQTDITTQTIGTDADGNQQIINTTTDAQQERWGINSDPNVRINGKPALKVKREIDTVGPSTSATDVIPAIDVEEDTDY